MESLGSIHCWLLCQALQLVRVGCDEFLYHRAKKKIMVPNRRELLDRMAQEPNGVPNSVVLEDLEPDMGLQ